MLNERERRPVSSLVRKVFLSLPRATKRKNSGVLHAHYEKVSTVAKLLTGLAQKDVEIASIRLDKRKVLLTISPHELYASIIVTLINRLYLDGVISGIDEIVLVASRMNTNRKLNISFSESVVNRMSGTNFNINIVKPSDDKCLQAVDFVSWALWQKYEKADNTYSDLVTDKIVKEYVMYE